MQFIRQIAKSSEILSSMFSDNTGIVETSWCVITADEQYNACM